MLAYTYTYLYYIYYIIKHVNIRLTVPATGVSSLRLTTPSLRRLWINLRWLSAFILPLQLDNKVNNGDG